MALDVLTGVTSEYLLNVGRTIQFLSDKYGKKISPEVGLKYTTSGSIAFIPSLRKSFCIRRLRVVSPAWGTWNGTSRTMSSGTAGGCPN